MLGQSEGIERGVPGEYLLDALFEVGPTQWSTDQESAISWSELEAYGRATQAISEPFEYRALMAMSKAYIRAKNEGKDVHCIAPVDRDQEQ